ncbi:MAG TPA: outer membrane lipoprotein carrier protein LolA [Geobacteraceae bacterium]|nr:outer membrane lipoprotein carrier protein LolA [Geobacteraceae bacterium]
MRLFLIVPALFMLVGVAIAAAEKNPQQPADMAAFMSELGKRASDFKTLKTDFTQEKKMAMFKEKMVMKGRIYLQKPSKIAWHVDSPIRYSVLITDKLIRQWDSDTDKVQEISLAKNPIFQNVLNQMNVWFSGSYGSMLDTNTVTVLKTDPLVIEFLPKEGNIAKKVIKNITITFRSDQKYLQQIRILENSGDITTIRFSNTQMNPPLNSTNFEVKGRV